jgi:hypothetical protein
VAAGVCSRQVQRFPLRDAILEPCLLCSRKQTLLGASGMSAQCHDICSAANLEPTRSARRRVRAVYHKILSVTGMDFIDPNASRTSVILMSAKAKLHASHAMWSRICCRPLCAAMAGGLSSIKNQENGGTSCRDFSSPRFSPSFHSWRVRAWRPRTTLPVPSGSSFPSAPAAGEMYSRARSPTSCRRRCTSR